MDTSFEDKKDYRIKIIGVGGGGANILNHISSFVSLQSLNIEFIHIDTVQQALANSRDNCKTILLGEDNRSKLATTLKESDIVFILAGLGGETGSSLSPLVAEIAKQNSSEIVVISMVTIPFNFEGKKCREQAEQAVSKLALHSDGLIEISNDKELSVLPKESRMFDCFNHINDTFGYAILDMIGAIVQNGKINMDIADIKYVLSESKMMLGVGTAKGDERGINAAKLAISKPLMTKEALSKAKKVMVMISSNEDEQDLSEVFEIMEYLGEQFSEDSDIVFSTNNCPELEDNLRVTLMVKVANHF